MKASVIVLLVLVLGGSLVSAEVIDLSQCTVVIPAGADGASVFVTPAATGVPFTSAFAVGGGTVDATVTASLITNFGNPVPGYPAEDMWIATTGGGLVLCSGAGQPDGATDVNGQAFWTAPVAGGGNSAGEDLQVFIAGMPLSFSVPLYFNSADLNGDLQVNLSDISVFTQALAAYSWAADFNNDTVVNLSDISRFVPAIGVNCD